MGSATATAPVETPGAPENAPTGTLTRPPGTSVDLWSELADAMLNAAGVVKASRNTDQNYSYASAEAILAAVRGPLLERRILLTAVPVSWVIKDIVSSSNKKGVSAVVHMDFTFRHGPSGETLTIQGWEGEAHDYPGAGARTKAYTNAVKTFVKVQWLLPTEDDGDSTPPPDQKTAAEPAWAKPVRNRKTFIDDLTALVGPEHAAAIDESGVNTYGHIPKIVADLTGALRNIIVPAQAPPAEPQGPANRRDPVPPAVDRDTESPAPSALGGGTDPNPATSELDEEPTPEQAALIERRLAETRPAGSVPHPKMVNAKTLDDIPRLLRGAGCTCEDPAAAEDNEYARDTHCPLIGHGTADLAEPSKEKP